ncbi:MAG: hypothetical protein LV480_11860 [Methylacidiphilales bacterium]|nr:hypothetical protein [Candidatus Methylacidiphilales bacterium]
MKNYAIVVHRAPDDTTLAEAIENILLEHFPNFISEADAGLYVITTDMSPENIRVFFEHIELVLSDTLLLIELGHHAVQFQSGSDFFRELEVRLKNKNT